MSYSPLSAQEFLCALLQTKPVHSSLSFFPISNCILIPFQGSKVKLRHGMWTRDYLNLFSSLSPSSSVYEDDQGRDSLFALQAS